jgi:hypothetical protein
MSVASESAFFTTAVRNPVTPEWDCACRVVEPGSARVSLPSTFSSRISNRSLIDSLRRDTSLRVSATQSRTISRAPPPEFQDTPPRFQALPPITKRDRPAIELSPETEDAIEDPTNLPDDGEVLRVIAKELRAQQNHYVDHQNYLEAHHLNKVLAAVEKKRRAGEAEESEIVRAKELVARHQELEAVVAERLREWNGEFEEFMRQTEQDAEDIRQKHQEQLDAYDASAPTDVCLKWCRRSPRLMQLRMKEARLAIQRDFDNAFKVRKEGDKEEKVEWEEAKFKTYQDWIVKRQKLVHDQEREMEAFLEHAEELRRSLIQKRDKNLVGILQRMNSLDKDIGTKERGLKTKTRGLDLEGAGMSENKAAYIQREEVKTARPALHTGKRTYGRDRSGRRR